MAVHYQSILFTAKRLGLKEIAAKCAITMLKYPEFIPADKAYYQAGNLCRELGGSYTNLAFMLLNR
jgi:intraflagellar transport protein 172